MTEAAKEARREYYRRYRAEHREQYAEYNKRYRASHKEQMKTYRETYWENRAKRESQ